MKLYQVSLLTLLFSPLISSAENGVEAKGSKGAKMSKAPKGKAPKSQKSPKASNGNAACCNRETWSVLNPNPSWSNHPFNTQVWYHTLKDIHDLWEEDYLDYVLDIRPLQVTSCKTIVFSLFKILCLFLFVYFHFRIFSLPSTWEYQVYVRFNHYILTK